MSSEQERIADKLDMLEEELKKLGLWQKSVPAWINNYEIIDFETECDFDTWLQFVFIPNQRNLTTTKLGQHKEYHLVASALKYFSLHIQKGKLLQVLIELDAII